MKKLPLPVLSQRVGWRRGHAARVFWLVAGVVVGSWSPTAQAQRTQQLPAISVTGTPVAFLPTDATDSSKLLDGTGLCGAFRPVSDNPALYFPARAAGYPGSVAGGTEPYAAAVNDFMDGVVGAAADKVVYQTLQTPFDLAAYNLSMGANATGDFGGPAECPKDPTSNTYPGCPFSGSGGATPKLPSFASRYRGFLRILPQWERQPVHFGFTTSSAVAMRLWPRFPTTNAASAPYELISRAASSGQSAYRVTNQITFQQAGLYSVEILHDSVGGAGRLEMALYVGDFMDIDENPAVVSTGLGARSFVIVPPRQFMQQTDGGLPFASQPAQCQQCPRKYAGNPDQPLTTANGCPDAMLCNEAGVCEPRTDAASCRILNGVCSPPTPACVLSTLSGRLAYSCVACTADAHCKTGQTCVDQKCTGQCVAGTPGCTTTEPPGGMPAGCSMAVGALRSDAPGPGTLAMLLGGLLVLGVVALRRRRAADLPMPT